MNNEETLKILKRISKIKVYFEKKKNLNNNLERKKLMTKISITFEKVIRYLEKN